MANIPMRKRRNRLDICASAKERGMDVLWSHANCSTVQNESSSMGLSVSSVRLFVNDKHQENLEA